MKKILCCFFMVIGVIFAVLMSIFFNIANVIYNVKPADDEDWDFYYD